jgi:hypothetical protein
LAFEGLLDGLTWLILDHRENNNDITSIDPIDTFPVFQSNELRFIRRRQIARNAGQTDYLILYAFELFSLLIE